MHKRRVGIAGVAHLQTGCARGRKSAIFAAGTRAQPAICADGCWRFLKQVIGVNDVLCMLERTAQHYGQTTLRSTGEWQAFANGFGDGQEGTAIW